VKVTLTDSTRALVPEVTARAAYRVVQEALTNAAKHAPGTAITVTMHDERHDEPMLVVNVINASSPEAPPRNNGPAGYGLIGLAERVRLVGGTLDARASDGGYAVTARLPLEPAAAIQTAAPTSSQELAAARRRLRRGLIGSVIAPTAMIAALILLYALNFGPG
jgi:signal transduction histidine kinase